LCKRYFFASTSGTSFGSSFLNNTSGFPIVAPDLTMSSARRLALPGANGSETPKFFKMAAALFGKNGRSISPKAAARHRQT